jgi:hypothetical protein
VATVPEKFYEFYFSQNTTPVDNYDYDGNGNLIYQGMAQVGTDPGTSGWVITKYVYQTAVIGGKTVYLLVHDSTLVNKTWNLRGTYIFP